MQYGLIGKKLTHSFSKEIHESFAPYSYELCEIEEEGLPRFMQRRDFCAINVTIPYKKAVIPFLDEISEQAQALQSVNTIVNKDGKLYGYNTDYLGLKQTVERSGVSLEGNKVLIFGSGATARVAHLVCFDLGAKEIHLVSRSIGEGKISYAEAYEIHNDADIIINATPVGTYPSTGDISVDVDKFSRLSAFFDVIYNPLRTEAVLRATRAGAVGVGGLYMLVSQAVYASALFTGATPPTTEQIERIYNDARKSKENIVITGMPCAGKTTVGKLCAGALGRKFIDIDDEIEALIGMKISEFFDTHSESEFRSIEADVVRKISLERGVVIATGGGTVLREDNVRALRSCGKIFFIDRSPSRLIPTESRPLARTRIDIERLYKSRYKLYTDTADVRINGDCSPETVTALLTEEFNK